MCECLCNLIAINHFNGDNFAHFLPSGQGLLTGILSSVWRYKNVHLDKVLSADMEMESKKSV